MIKFLSDFFQYELHSLNNLFTSEFLWETFGTLCLLLLFGAAAYSVTIASKGNFKKVIVVLGCIWIVTRLIGYFFFSLPGGTVFWEIVIIWRISGWLTPIIIGYLLSHIFYSKIHKK